MRSDRTYYRLKGPSFAWGAFGQILVAGYFDTDPEDESSSFGLLRTGPFVPPISFSTRCVVTAEFRVELESSGLQGIEFEPVLKRRIVEIHWDAWDRTAELESWQLPDAGPEDYLLSREHSPELSNRIGDLWSLNPPAIQRSCGSAGWVFSRSDLAGLDFFVDSSYASPIFASEQAKAWLQQRVPEWVVFEPT